MSKRIFYLILCFTLLLSSLFLSAYAVSADEGLTALRAQFSRDEGPQTNGYAIDYSYFSPVKDSSDNTKYPLVVIMAGATEGAYEGKELLANEFAVWSGEEYQSRFVASGGSFILIARAPEEKLLYWNSSKLVKPLKATLDDFIKKHPNVDTSRISVMGWCLGARGALNMACEYPDFFSAAVIMVQPFVISDEEAETLKNMPVWLVGCKSDSYASYNMYISPSWQNLKEHAQSPSLRRFTSFDSAVDTTFFFNHNVWLQFSYDMHYTGSGYSGMKTVDGAENEIDTSTGIIIWLSVQGLKIEINDSAENENCTCLCHSQNKILRAVWKVLSVFKFLFSYSSNKVCSCGAEHW